MLRGSGAGYILRHGRLYFHWNIGGTLIMDKITPEQLASKNVDKGIKFSPYETGTTDHVRYADEILRLTTEAGKKK